MSGPAAPTRRSLAPGRRDPRQDPRYRAATEALQAAAQRLKRHAPPAQKAREASRATRAPAGERLAGAQARAVEQTGAAPTPPPRPASFKAQLRAEIARAMPKTLGETESFMNAGQAGAMKQSLGAGVARQQDQAAGALEAANGRPPNPGAVPAQPSTPLPPEPVPPPPRVDGAAAMPAPATEAEVSLQDSKRETGQRLAEAQVTPQQLRRAQDPRFSAVLGAQARVAAQADSAPATYRAQEAGVLAGARAQAAGLAGRGALLLAGTRAGGNARVLGRQQQQAAREEAERARVAATVQAIYARTRERVTARLRSLDAEVPALFDAGVEAAIGAMKTYVDARIRAYKFDRYLSIPLLGQARWVKDQFVGLPEEVNAFYAHGQRLFQSRMEALIDRVATLVETRLAQAKAEVAAGQAEIRRYVGALPGHLRAAGQAAERALAERFAELDRAIDEKRDALASSLALQYQQASERAGQALQKMRDDNRGLLQGFVEQLAEVVNAIREFKARIGAALRRGEATLQLILADPGAFLGRLLDAVKGGFNRFVDNIWTHLKAGFLAWMFGSLAAVGVALPPDFSLASIFALVLQVLGLTYERVRARAVRLLGDRAVAVIERVAGYVRDLFTGGPARLWEHVQQDLADLKGTLVDTIQSWLISTLIKQAVLKVVSMFNPVGAIIQVILTIVNVVMFVVEQARRILALIEAVLGSVHAIATGAIDSAIAWVERALASAVPIVIAFLARLLGLTGLAQRIQDFIRRIQARVEAAIDRVLTRVVALARRAAGAVAGAARAGVQQLLAWWRKKKPFSGAGQRHTLQFDGERGNARLMVHTTPVPPEGFVQDFKPSQAVAGVKAQNRRIAQLQADLTAEQAKPAPTGAQALKDRDARLAALDKDLDAAFNALGDLLAAALEGGKDQGDEKDPLPVVYPKRRAAAYPRIYIGPYTTQRVPQSALKAVASIGPPARQKQALADALAAASPKVVLSAATLKDWTWGVRVFTPEGGPSQPLPKGGEVGLAPQFRSLAPGKLLMYDAHGGTGGGGKVNRLFKPYGFVPSINGGESLDGDHVLERQLGGPDHLHNLWPLNASDNRSSGSLVKELRPETTGPSRGKTVHQLRDARPKSKPLYLLVKATRET